AARRNPDESDSQTCTTASAHVGLEKYSNSSHRSGVRARVRIYATLQGRPVCPKGCAGRLQESIGQASESFRSLRAFHKHSAVLLDRRIARSEFRLFQRPRTEGLPEMFEPLPSDRRC